MERSGEKWSALEDSGAHCSTVECNGAQWSAMEHSGAEKILELLGVMMRCLAKDFRYFWFRNCCSDAPSKGNGFPIDGEGAPSEVGMIVEPLSAGNVEPLLAEDIKLLLSEDVV